MRRIIPYRLAVLAAAMAVLLTACGVKSTEVTTSSDEKIIT